MYYELYIDVFFAENFMMDYLLLLFIRRLMKTQIEKTHLFLGAFTGAVLTCFVVWIPLPFPLFKQILLHVCVNALMLLTGLRLKEKRTYLGAWILLYAGGVLMGGIMTLFIPYLRTGSLFFLLALSGYYLSCMLWDLLAGLARKNSYRCCVVLVKGINRIEVDALIDSGNTLTDKLTGEPVCVITKKAARQLWGEIPIKNLRYISYHSIGKKNGTMPLLQADCMGVKGMEKETIDWIAEPLIAVCEEEIFTEGYDMILNLDILTGGSKYDDKNCGSAPV